MLRPGDLLICILAVAPLAAAGDMLLAMQEVTPAAILNRLGRASGILGLTLLFLAASLSARVPRLDRWFGGLTRLWKVHHVLGLAAFLLLLLHPLLLAFAAVPVSVQAAVGLLFPGPESEPLWAGWIALLAMMGFLAPTFAFFGKPAYQRWKRIHLLAGLALACAIVHTLGLARSLTDTAGSLVWLGLAALAASAYLYRALLARWLGRRPYRVSAVRHLAPGVVELSLRPSAGAVFEYAAGQFVYLALQDAGLVRCRGEEHPYTLTSAPAEAELRVAIKDLGDATHAIQGVAPGSRATVEGPYGWFFPPGVPDRAELWIAGGIGITPFVARARALEQAGASVDVDLFYCADEPSQAYYLTEFRDIAAKVAGLRLWPHYRCRDGHALDIDFIAARCPDFATRETYLCGPPPLIQTLRRRLRRRGERRRIHSEEFSFL